MVYYKYVIHAVGPRWEGGKNKEEKTLEKAILNTLEMADNSALTSISIPAISTDIQSKEFHFLYPF